MHKNEPLYKWIILLLIPLMAIAFILYRKASYCPTSSEPTTQQQATQPVSQTTPEPSDNFFDYSEPEDAPVDTEEKTVEVVLPEIKQPEKKPVIKEKIIPAPKPVKQKIEKEVKTEKTEKSTEPAPAKSLADPQAKKNIKLILDMNKKSLAYKYLFIHYSPSKWTLKLDGNPVLTFDGKHLTQVKNSITIDPEKPLAARFDFEFLGGKKFGWKEVMYQIDKNADAIHIQFDWKDPKDDQILISPAKALSKTGHNNHEGKK